MHWQPLWTVPLIVLVLTTLAQAQTRQPVAGSDWLGRSVMPKPDTRYRIGDRDDSRPQPLPLEVVAEDGDWLIVGFARIRKADVVPLERAREYYEGLLKADPRSSWAHCQRGILDGVNGELEQARRDFDRSIELDPANAEAWAMRGLWHATNENQVEALQDFDQALRLQPDYADAWHQRGTYRFEVLDEDDKALADFTAAIKACPQFSDAYNSRGLLKQYRGQLKDALVDYDLALRYNPYAAEALSNRALIRAAGSDAALRDGKLAVVDATRACELTHWQDAEILATLAAAYAESGQFQDAIQTQMKAVRLAPRDERVDYLARVRLYQQQKPYRYDE